MTFKFLSYISLINPYIFLNKSLSFSVNIKFNIYSLINVNENAFLSYKYIYFIFSKISILISS